MSPVFRRGSRSAAKKRRLHPVAISMQTNAGVVFVIYYAFHQGLPFIHNFTLHALVNNSAAVRQDQPVRIAGIDVGKVTSTSPAGRMTEVNFTVDDNGQPVHRDATIRIRGRLFLEGSYYLDLDPGSPSAPVLHDGDTIPLSQTQSPVQFYQVLSTFDSAARTSLENTLNTLNDALSSEDSQNRPVANPGSVGFKEAIPQLTPNFKDAAWISRGLRGTQVGDVRNLLGTSSQVTTTLARNSSQLADLITGLNATSSSLAAADGALAQSVSGLDQTLQVAPAALSALDKSLPPVANLSVALDPSLKLAPGLVDGIIKAVTELGAIVAPVERAKLLTTLKTTFQQFPTLLTRFATVFPVTKSVTDCLRTHITPVLQSTVPDGALSTGQPVWQEFVHFLGGLASASQDFDANGHWIRYLVGAGTGTTSLGNLPVVGQLTENGPPGGGAIQGSSPHWIGDIGGNVFHPEASCPSQPVTSDFSVRSGPSGAQSFRASQAPKPLTVSQLRAAIARAAARTARGSH